MKNFIKALVILAVLFFVPLQYAKADCIIAVTPNNNTATAIQTDILHAFHNYVMICTQKEYNILVKGKKYFPVVVFKDPANSKDAYCIDPNEIPGYKREQFLNLVSNEINTVNVNRTILVTIIPPLIAALVLLLDKSERKPLHV